MPDLDYTIQGEPVPWSENPDVLCFQCSVTACVPPVDLDYSLQRLPPTPLPPNPEPPTQEQCNEEVCATVQCEDALP